MRVPTLHPSATVAVAGANMGGRRLVSTHTLTCPLRSPQQTASYIWHNPKCCSRRLLLKVTIHWHPPIITTRRHVSHHHQHHRGRRSHLPSISTRQRLHETVHPIHFHGAEAPHLMLTLANTAAKWRSWAATMAHLDSSAAANLTTTSHRHITQQCTFEVAFAMYTMQCF